MSENMGMVVDQEILKALYESKVFVFTVPEVASILRIGRNKAYEMARHEVFPVIRFGERGIRIPRQALINWIESQIQATPQKGSLGRPSLVV